MKKIAPTLFPRQMTLSPINLEELNAEPNPEPELDTIDEISSHTENDIIEDLCTVARERNKFVPFVQKAIDTNQRRHSHAQLSKFEIRSENLYVDNKQYTPNSIRLVQRFVSLPDPIVAGPGRTKMIALMYRNFWLPNLPHFVARWI